jgi:hypothetical protein
MGKRHKEGKNRNANQLRDKTMKKLHILATAAALLIASSAPSFAASRTHHHHARTDRDYSTNRGYESYSAAPGAQGWGGAGYTGQNLPYPDRPYGDPDSW